MFGFYMSVCKAGPSSPGGDPDAPVDGGLATLVVAGIGYTLKRRGQKNSIKIEKL